MRKFKKKHLLTNVEKVTPEYDVDLLVEKSHATFVKRMKISGYAFLVMGFALVALSLIYGQNNESVADYIVSICMQFLPGTILLIAGFKTLREV